MDRATIRDVAIGVMATRALDSVAGRRFGSEEEDRAGGPDEDTERRKVGTSLGGGPLGDRRKAGEGPETARDRPRLSVVGGGALRFVRPRPLKIILTARDYDTEISLTCLSEREWAKLPEDEQPDSYSYQPSTRTYLKVTERPISN